MNCEQARELAALAASGDVTVAEQRALESHAAECAACRAEVVAFEALWGQLASMREESAPDHAYAAVRARVAAEIGDRQRRNWLAAWPAFAAVLACSVVLVVLLRPEAPVATQPAELPTRPVVAVVDVPAPTPSVRQTRRPVARVKAQAPGEPLVVRLLTNDPDVVIYWIADGKRRESEKEIIQ